METTVREILEKYRDEIMDEGRVEGIQEGMQQGRKEGMLQGRKEGMLQGKINTIVDLFKKNLIKLTYAAEELGMSEDEFIKLVN